MSEMQPKASVIVCTHDANRLDDLLECVESLMNQTYKDFEVIVAIDHNQFLFEGLKGTLAGSRIRVVSNDSSTRGQASTMNRGLQAARGEIACFIDDDAVASPDWLSRLIGSYEKGAIAAGGRTEPRWLALKPAWFPEELYWLVGATGTYLPQKTVEVRNLWSGNVSFRRALFERTGPFLETLGRSGNALFQGEDTEYGVRLLNTFGKGIVYVPDAVVYHKVRTDRLRLQVLLRRAFLQGHTKAYIVRLHGTCQALSVEAQYTVQIIRALLRSIKACFLGSKRSDAFAQFLFLVLSAFAVAFGFVHGYMEGGK